MALLDQLLTLWWPTCQRAGVATRNKPRKWRVIAHKRPLCGNLWTREHLAVWTKTCVYPRTYAHIYRFFVFLRSASGTGLLRRWFATLFITEVTARREKGVMDQIKCYLNEFPLIKVILNH